MEVPSALAPWVPMLGHRSPEAVSVGPEELVAVARVTEGARGGLVSADLRPGAHSELLGLLRALGWGVGWALPVCTRPLPTSLSASVCR